MSRIRQILMAGGTFSVALGIGFVMQNGDALAGRFTDDSAAPPMVSQPLVAVMPQVPTGALPAAVVTAMATPVAATLAEVVAAVAMPQDPMSPRFAPDQTVLAAVETGPLMSDALPMPPAEPVAPALVCDAHLGASVQPAAMVGLTLTAPCSPDAAVVIHHQGMMFSIVTDAAGTAQVSVPALAEVAVFVAELDGGQGAAATAMVPELAGFDRAVLQWQGLGGMQLHALEFGAGYDDAGHVWAGAARVAGITDGFITPLGDARAAVPMLAEVYSYPIDAAAQDGAIDLSVEAEVTAANCGRDLAAQSIQITPGAEVAVVDLTMTMPDCSAVGEFLVLDNMLTDLTLASN